MTVTRMTGTKFQLGQVVATRGAATELTAEDLLLAITRHAACDWGWMPEEDKRRNEKALTTGDRLMSAYVSLAGRKFWVITESDRSVTTILFPEEY